MGKLDGLSRGENVHVDQPKRIMVTLEIAAGKQEAPSGPSLEEPRQTLCDFRPMLSLSGRQGFGV